MINSLAFYATINQEASEGHYRVLQCAYGSVQRAARGVLKIEVPKAEAARERTIDIKVR